MTVERSKRRCFLTLTFLVKSVSKNLLIQIRINQLKTPYKSKNEISIWDRQSHVNGSTYVMPRGWKKVKLAKWSVFMSPGLNFSVKWTNKFPVDLQTIPINTYYLRKTFKWLTYITTFCDMSQHVATRWPNACDMFLPTMLRSFGRSFTLWVFKVDMLKKVVPFFFFQTRRKLFSFRIKTSDKKRRFDLSEIIFKL